MMLRTATRRPPAYYAGRWCPQVLRRYPAAVTKPLLIATLCLSPAAARAATTTAADPPTGGDAASDGETDSDSDGDSGVDTGTMPPVYEPCGCRADQAGPGFTALLAALGLCLRRRRAR